MEDEDVELVELLNQSMSPLQNLSMGMDMPKTVMNRL